jgi:hypothetical protein
MSKYDLFDLQENPTGIVPENAVLNVAIRNVRSDFPGKNLQRWPGWLINNCFS